MTLAQRLLIENATFFLLSTTFLLGAGWRWRNTRPYELPKPLPTWFQVWFGVVQFWGSVPPLIAMICSFWQGIPSLKEVLLAYFVLLALQVVIEVLTLRQFQSIAWIMVPYLYVPYRLWQLWEGLWGSNYLLDLSQLPRLLQWPEATDS